MIDRYEILRMRVLIYFLKNEKRECTVMRIARTLDVTKQRISRIIIELEKEGYADRTDNRHPCLTQKGIDYANSYAEKIQVCLNHLIFEGVPLERAEEDAYYWAIYNTDETMKVIRKSEAKNKAKFALKDLKTFSGKELCRSLPDGKYDINFIIYGNDISDVSELSVANSGFEHPAHLIVKDGVGKLRLHIIEIIEYPEEDDEVEIRGKVRSIKYKCNDEFVLAELSNDVITLPAEIMQFVNISEGLYQFVHGNVAIKVKCDVTPVPVPEHNAVIAIFL